MNKEDLARYVGNKIKEFRTRRGMTQEELAELMGTTKQSIGRYENGSRRANQDNIFDLAEIFNRSIDDFFPNISENKLNITTIYNQLEPPRQRYVYDVAEQQLEEQNNVLKFPEGKQIIRGRQTAAGSALYSDDYGTHTEVLSASMVPRGADELVEVVGKSMEPLIKDGEDVYIRHQPQVENGEIAIVRIEGDGVTCKRFYVDGDTITLKSENPEYGDMHFDPSQVIVLGKVLL